MTAGDIDDTLAPAASLTLLRNQYRILDVYLKKVWELPPCRNFFIPFGAGIAEDGSRVYISNDIQTVIDGVDCASALIRHESTEWGVRHFCGIGLNYSSDPRGHRLGNRAEHDRVVALLDRPDAWERYSEVIDPQVVIDERQDVMDKPIPRDLAMYPYEDELVNEMEKAMFNERSTEEWERL